MIQQNQLDFLRNHIVDKMTEYLVRDYGMDIPTALKIIYDSQVYTQLQDTEGELYVQSPSYVYVLLQTEKGLSNITQVGI